MEQNILFTCAGRRNYLINYFKEALNGNGNVVAADNQVLAPALIDADIAVKVPDIYDKNYIPKLKEIINTYSITAIISLNDLELPILSRNKEELEKEGARVLVSDKDVIAIGFDKWKTYNFIKDLGLNTPKTYIDINEAIKDINDQKLKFPLVLKPRWGSGSIAIDFPETIDELKLSYKLQKIKLGRSILSRASDEDIEQAILIQEKLDGKEYGLDIVNNFNKEYFGTFVKEKLSMRSGETDKASSVISDAFEGLGEKIGSNLKHLGNMDADVFLVNEELYVLELNPRFGGGYPFSHEAGANIVSTYVDWLNGKNNQEASNNINYKKGITFSKCDRLLKISDQSSEIKLIVNEVIDSEDISLYHTYIDKLECDNPYSKTRVLNSYLHLQDDRFKYFVFIKSDIPIVIMPFYFREVYVNDKLTSYFDVCSPYGYSGPFYNDSLQKEKLLEFWKYVDSWYKENNVISEFIRFSLNRNHHFYSGKLIPTLTNVQGKILNEEEQWKNFKSKVRNNYRKAIKNNLEFRVENGEICEDKIKTFYSIYISTMKRNNASKQYHYPLTYFIKFIKENINKCAIAMVYKDNLAISVELLLLSKKTIYSFLGGTLHDYFYARPNDFLKIEVMKWARKNEIENYVLGGGIENNDNLYKYKKSFFPEDQDVIYYTGRKIVNDKIYNKLIKKVDAKKSLCENFFPAYRNS
ncbi:GNAT family N-acetyltransferase [Flavivirga rizhaonensis]|uniref:GNAT family N-acetyltransferase n=1 Tax=Flavivirga rizhaonensis TaxID=2559571 RepID=A0A4S1E0U1_9FLAO|nr:GNAT family N-acetyltransferase [Flavivirga rizhaonensis]TGV03923.1 GNAT family N-acetyltransferase [Flavivirga rizhaonensis]